MTWGSGFAGLRTKASDVRDYDCSAEVTEDIRICEPVSICRAPMMRSRACVVRCISLLRDICLSAPRVTIEG